MCVCVCFVFVFVTWDGDDCILMRPGGMRAVFFSGLFMGHDPSHDPSRWPGVEVSKISRGESGRVWWSQAVYGISRVGSGRVGSGRVGSGRVGSGWVSRFSNLTGRIGSGNPDPIRSAKTHPTCEKPFFFRLGRVKAVFFFPRGGGVRAVPFVLP